MKLDPSRTTLLRRKFMKDMNKRFKAVAKAVRILIVEDDALGLKSTVPLFLHNAVGNVVKQAWRFQTDATKVKSFRGWLKQQVNSNILITKGGIAGKPWTAEYVESAYRKGMLRAYTDARRGKMVDTADFYRGSQREFLRSSFLAPEVLSKVELIYTRAYNSLQGVTDTMANQMSRILADGIANGYGVSKIANNLTDTISKLTRTRANAIARTEVIHAHAEGQLDAFEKLDIDEVEAEVESLTAGDYRVCDECADLQAAGTFKISKARGLIPVHVNCRCCWVPIMKKDKGRLARQPTVTPKKIIRKKLPKVTMHLKGIAPKYDAPIKEELARLLEQFPKVGKVLKKVVLMPAQKYAKYAGNSVASVGKVGKTSESILLNARYWGKKSKFDVTKIAKRHRRSGMTVEKTAKDAITHEFGHIVQSSLPARGIDDLFDFAWSIEYAEKTERTYRQIGKQIGKYAQKNYKEAFAEAFTQWQMGEASPMARKILKIGGLKIGKKSIKLPKLVKRMKAKKR